MPDDTCFASVAEALTRLVLPGPVGVAVSGGGDSMALLAMAAQAGLPVHAATVDHGLRPEARTEAAQVARFCADQTIPHDVLTIGKLSPDGNLSANLREGRYQALATWARANAIHQVLLGHTMDDQAETVLMRLARGSGVQGLAGMYETREDAGIRWLRPLLSVRRAELRTWLTGQGVGWADDPTNEDTAFDRIRTRKALEVVAPLGLTVDRLARSAETFKRQAEVLNAAVMDLRASAALPSTQGRVSLDRASLRAAHEDTTLRLLGEVLSEVGKTTYQPRLDALLRLRAQICQENPFRTTLNGCLIESVDSLDQVLIRPEPAASRSA